MSEPTTQPWRSPSEYEKDEIIEEVKRQNAFAEALGVSPQQLINEINDHALRNP